MNKFKKRINKIKKLELLIKRLLYPIFHNTHPLLRNKDYIRNLFYEKTLEYNIEALDFNKGIVLGTFQGKDYLMNCQPGNLIESTIYLKKVEITRL